MAFTNTSVICLPGILGCIEHVVQLSVAFREYNTPDEGFFFAQLSLWKTSHDLAAGLAGKASDKTHDNLQRLAGWFDEGDRCSLCTSGYLKLNSRETEEADRKLDAVDFLHLRDGRSSPEQDAFDKAAV
jgi:hypothetical protein